jgi:hypothetical protein
MLRGERKLYYGCGGVLVQRCTRAHGSSCITGRRINVVSDVGSGVVLEYWVHTFVRCMSVYELVHVWKLSSTSQSSAEQGRRWSQLTAVVLSRGELLIVEMETRKKWILSLNGSGERWLKTVMHKSDRVTVCQTLVAIRFRRRTRVRVLTLLK